MFTNTQVSLYFPRSMVSFTSTLFEIRGGHMICFGQKSVSEWHVTFLGGLIKAISIFPWTLQKHELDGTSISLLLSDDNEQCTHLCWSALDTVHMTEKSSFCCSKLNFEAVCYCSVSWLISCQTGLLGEKTWVLL